MGWALTVAATIGREGRFLFVADLASPTLLQQQPRQPSGCDLLSDSGTSNSGRTATLP